MIKNRCRHSYPSYSRPVVSKHDYLDDHENNDSLNEDDSGYITMSPQQLRHLFSKIYSHIPIEAFDALVESFHCMPQEKIIWRPKTSEMDELIQELQEITPLNDIQFLLPGYTIAFATCRDFAEEFEFELIRPHPVTNVIERKISIHQNQLRSFIHISSLHDDEHISSKSAQANCTVNKKIIFTAPPSRLGLGSFGAMLQSEFDSIGTSTKLNTTNTSQLNQSGDDSYNDKQPIALCIRTKLFKTDENSKTKLFFIFDHVKQVNLRYCRILRQGLCNTYPYSSFPRYSNITLLNNTNDILSTKEIESEESDREGDLGGLYYSKKGKFDWSRGTKVEDCHLEGSNSCKNEKIAIQRFMDCRRNKSIGLMNVEDPMAPMNSIALDIPLQTLDYY